MNQCEFDRVILRLCSDELGSYLKDDPTETLYVHSGLLRMTVTWRCSDDGLEAVTEDATSCQD